MATLICFRESLYHKTYEIVNDADLCSKYNYLKFGIISHIDCKVFDVQICTFKAK